MMEIAEVARLHFIKVFGMKIPTCEDVVQEVLEGVVTIIAFFLLIRAIFLANFSLVVCLTIKFKILPTLFYCVAYENAVMQDLPKKCYFVV